MCRSYHLKLPLDQIELEQNAIKYHCGQKVTDQRRVRHLKYGYVLSADENALVDLSHVHEPARVVVPRRFDSRVRVDDGLTGICAANAG